MSSEVTASAVKARARELGFDLCGISPAADLPELKFLRDWLDRGFGGDKFMFALALGRSEEQIEGMLNGAEDIDEDLEMKVRGIAQERGIDIS